MSNFLAELIGTAILILLGDGVVANVVLKKTKGHDSGWIVITAGWGLGVAVAIYCVGQYSGAHINPAVTIALAALGSLSWLAMVDDDARNGQHADAAASMHPTDSVSIPGKL